MLSELRQLFIISNSFDANKHANGGLVGSGGPLASHWQAAATSGTVGWEPFIYPTPSVAHPLDGQDSQVLLPLSFPSFCPIIHLNSILNSFFSSLARFAFDGYRRHCTTPPPQSLEDCPTTSPGQDLSVPLTFVYNTPAVYD